MNKTFLRAFHDIFTNFKRLVIVGLLAGFFSAIAPIISIYFSQEIINEITRSQDFYSVIKFIIVSLVIIFISQIIGGLFSYLYTYEENDAIRQLELQRNLKMTKMEFQYVEDPDIKEMRKRLTIMGYGGSPTMEMLMNQFRLFIFYVTSIVSAIAIVVPIFLKRSNSIYDSPIFSILFIILIGLFTIIPYRFSKSQNKKLESLFKNVNHANTLFNYIASLIFKPEAHKEVRLYNQQKILHDTFSESKSEDNFTFQIAATMTKIWVVIHFITLIVSMILLLALYLFLGLKVMKGNIGLGYIVSGGAALTMLINVMPEFVELISIMFSNSAGLDYHYEYMDLPNQTQVGSIPVEKRLDNDYKLSAHDITFSYPKTEKEVLKDINIEFEVGKSYAIVGENGSGKTTFIKLLTRLYDPEIGEIRLNGISADKYDSQQFYSLFNVVFQDFDLFSFKLGETVAASSTYDQQRVIETFKEVGFYDRYLQLEKGLETSLNKEFDKDGITLSGGEQQKLAIARALYKDGPIFILDEPTAALDPISEFEIYQQFHKMTQGKTSLIISHRLSSCRFSDQILVFDEGSIVQQGTHEELLNQAGKYAQLWHAQAQYYQEQNIDTSAIGL